MTVELGDAARFRVAYEAHGRAILAYAARRCGSLDAAGDILADTMLVAWRRIDDLPSEPDTRLWLYGIARHVLANHHRSQTRRARLGDRLRQQLTNSANDISVADPSISTSVRNALARLSAVEREVMLLTAAEGLTPNQISTVLDVNASTVRTHLQRARHKLRNDFVAAGIIDVDEVVGRQHPTGHERDGAHGALYPRRTQEAPR